MDIVRVYDAITRSDSDVAGTYGLAVHSLHDQLAKPPKPMLLHTRTKPAKTATWV